MKNHNLVVVFKEKCLAISIKDILYTFEVIVELWLYKISTFPKVKL